MGINIETLVAAKKFTSETVLGGGAVVGKNVTISSITPIDGGNRITFSYTLDNGTTKTSTLDVMNGVNGTDGKDGKNGAKGAKGDPGQNGQDGTNGHDGIGISKIEKTKTEGLVDTYVITFSDDSTFEYTVTNGKDGKNGAGSSIGEENVIESIKVNGVSQTVAEDKSVDIIVPTVDVDKNYVDTELAKKANTNHTHTTVNGHTVESNVPVDAKFTDTVYDDSTIKEELAKKANTSDIPSLDGYVTDKELNAKRYLTEVPSEYITEEELTSKGYLTFHQDISSKVDKVNGKSLIADTEIERLKSVKNYDDTEIKTELTKKANSTDVTKEISDKIAEVVSDAPESFNTLKEISDWISGHENDASAMNSAIKDNKSAITTLQTDKADKTEIPTVPTLISAFTNDKGYMTEYTETDPTVPDWAKAENKPSYTAAEVHALPDDTEIPIFTNKTVLDGITAEKVADWDETVTDKHSHTNKTVIDKFTESDDGTVLYNGEQIASGNLWNGTKAEYDVITPKDADTTYIVTDEEDTVASALIDDTKIDTQSTWSSKKINSYSNDEQIIGTYLDDKIIYRRSLEISLDGELQKTFDFIHQGVTALEGGEDISIYVNQIMPTADLSSWNIDTMVKVYGHVIDYTDTTKTEKGVDLPYPVTYSAKAYVDGWYNYKTKLYTIRVGEQYANRSTVFLTFEYTKN